MTPWLWAERAPWRTTALSLPSEPPNCRPRPGGTEGEVAEGQSALPPGIRRAGAAAGTAVATYWEKQVSPFQRACFIII